jgi:hypothetical protein
MASAVFTSGNIVVPIDSINFKWELKILFNKRKVSTGIQKLWQINKVGFL